MDTKATVDTVGTPADGSTSDPDFSHYYTGSPRVASQPTAVEVSLPDMVLELTGDRGVFSADRLDPGTKLLLLEAPPLSRSDRTVLDLGCGWGAIACVAGRRAPWADVWAIDVNDRALDLTARNASHAGVTVRVARPDDVPADLRFDRILSNPPVRIGKQALHELLERWLDRLSVDGRAQIVVNRKLGGDSLGDWLHDRGHTRTRLVSRLGYRVLEIGPRAADDAAGDVDR